MSMSLSRIRFSEISRCEIYDFANF